MTIDIRALFGMNIFRKILAHNWWAIIYFNFRMLPWRQAIKLPFDFYYGVRFENLSGLVFLDSTNIHRAMIKFGGRGSEMYGRHTTVLDLRGEIRFNGVCEMGHGSLLRVEPSGSVLFGDHVRIGALSKIICSHRIEFGREIDFSWECQIFDTNFHFVRNLENGVVEVRDRAVSIGSYNWFGNRVTVMKGVQTPDYCIVASNSLCTKNYTNNPIYSIIGGIPAVFLQSGKQRVFENLEDVSNWSGSLPSEEGKK